MKAKILCLLLTLAMLASLMTAMAVCVSADSAELQVCTDIIEVNGVGHESTSQLTAEAWFDQTYGDIVVDEDGSISTFRVRGWVNPLDGSDMVQYGYSIGGDIVWDDSFMAPNEGLASYFPKAERFDVTVNLTFLPVGTYEFHLYAKTSSGVYVVAEEDFVFEKKASAVTNVALNKTVTADYSMEASFFGAAMLTDGVVAEFNTADDPLGWTSGVGDPMFQQQDQEIWIYIDLAGKHEVGCVNVLPQKFLNGSGFPSSFTILTGMALSDLSPVASVEKIHESGEFTDPVVLSFAPVVCKYVALRVDRASSLQEQDGSYLSEIGEVEVIGKAVPKATYTVTFKDGDKVIATVTYEEGAKSIDVPEVPVKEGCVGEWAAFKLEDKDIEVKAIYTLVTSAETDAPTEPATDPATEPATEPATAANSEPATAADTEPATGEDASGSDTASADEGCASVMTASAAVLVLLLGGAVVLNKRKD